MHINQITYYYRRLRQSESITSVLSIGILTIFVKMVAALKEIIIAYRYGVSNELDAYLIAYMYGSFMVNILAGSLSAAIVPAYIRIKLDHGLAAGRELISNLTGWSVILFIAAAICLGLASPWLIPLIGSGFDHHTMELTLKMVPILVTVVIFFGLSSVWSPVINSHNSFKLPALTPIFPSLGIIGFVIICPVNWGGYPLAIGTAIGYFIEMVLLGVWLRHFRLSPFPTLNISSSLKDIGVQLLPLMLAAMMSTGMGVVDQSMAAMLENGSVAALNFGYRIVGIVFSFSAAIWIVALPKFSFIASAKDYDLMERTLKIQIKAILLFTIPLVVALILFSHEVVKILFERGAFTAEDTKIVALIQAYYVIQTPFFISSGLMMRMLSSLNHNRILMWGGAIALGLNVILNILLMRFFNVAGIALSTSLVSVFTFCFLFIVLHLKLKVLKRKF